MDGDDATGDLLIGAGALYVGGQRVPVAQPFRYGDQPEWADREGDSLWRAPAVPPQPRELLYLLAREQEVSAVEDPALRDVALGGPDTTQRLRILRRVIRHPTTARTWEEAWSQLVREQWIPRGFGSTKPAGASGPPPACRSPPIPRTAGSIRPATAAISVRTTSSSGSRSPGWTPAACRFSSGGTTTPRSSTACPARWPARRAAPSGWPPSRSTPTTSPGSTRW